ncbi:MAG TPA: serine/threonine-protein kinase [Kofleriaceae bacterium]
MGCPSDGELLAFVDATLQAGARVAIDAHLDACPDCLAAVAALVAAQGLAPAASDLATTQHLADGEPRYVLDHEIARGGMGRIFAAHDRLLDRPVALKLLRANDPELGRRFLRERLITARLQHPAILPIYDAGTLDGGEPFFAMRMVSGKTLDRAAAGASTLEERLRLLPAVIGVADAIAYAHGEGVIHRDLKPQNVLVGPFGEVVVLDWGIARVGREVDEAVATTAEPAGEQADGVTRAGEVLGTLAYMAPEQAAGAPVDERADVFGLGAILYQVITGEAPNEDRTSIDSAAKSVAHVAGDLARFPDLPPELVAIIERAMAPAAADRYATAQDLAEDLKRWQAGRMVKAHDYTPGQLVLRWLRKHRTKLAVIGAAGAVAVVLGSLALWQVIVERRVAESERDRAETARASADTQRAAAEALLEFVLGDLRERLDKVGRIDALSGVARAVLAYQQRSPTPDSAHAWLQRSSASRLAGDVAIATGDFATADVAFTRALVAANLAALHRFSPRIGLAKCRAYLGLGESRKGLGALADAGTAFAACVELASDSSDLELREHLIASRIGQSRLARVAGDLAGSLALLDEVLPDAVARVRAEGPAGNAATDLASLRHERMNTARLIGLVPVVVEEANALLALAEARIAKRPDDVEARRALGNARLAVGFAEEATGRDAEAETAYLAGLADARAVAAREPSNAEWQRDVSVATDHLGALKLKTGHHAEALAWLRESDAISQRVAALEPNNLEWQRDLATSAMTLGDALMALDRGADAREALKKAIVIYERLAQTPNAEGRMRHELGMAYGHLGGAEITAGDRRAAAVALRRSVELLRESLVQGDTPQGRHELAAGILLLAQVVEGRDAARAAIADALSIIAPLRATAAENPELAELIVEADRLAARFGVK